MFESLPEDTGGSVTRQQKEARVTRSDLIVCMCFTCHLEEEDAELAPTQHQVRSSQQSSQHRYKVEGVGYRCRFRAYRPIQSGMAQFRGS